MGDNSALRENIVSEAINFFQVEPAKIKNVEESEVLINKENKKSIIIPTTESMFIDETKKVEDFEKSNLDGQKPLKEKVSKQMNEPLKEQDKAISMEADKSVQLKTYQQSALLSDKVLSTSNNLKEFELPTQKNRIEPTQKKVSQENLMKCSQQVIPDTKSVSYNDKQLEDNGTNLKSVLNLKHSQFKNIVMNELSELTEKPSQNVETPNLEIKPENIKNDEHRNYKIKTIEDTKTNLKNELINENNVHDDPLSTLASAALNQEFPTYVVTNNNMLKSASPVAKIKQEGPAWCDVGVIKGNTCLVKQFYATSISDEHENTSIDLLPDYQNKLKIDIQPGTTYKLRIAAINSCGRGEWSDIAAFKTCLPGYPGAPSNIKISKSSQGVSLKWEAPPNDFGQILEYTVCLAIKNPKGGMPSSQSTPTPYNFYRVYSGPHNAANVSHESLSAALIDRTNKPAIIFRIAARNEKGYGPATQVRWLQDSKASNKRENVEDLLTFETKRSKF